MKRLILIFGLILSLWSCNGQVPGIGGMVPNVSESEIMPPDPDITSASFVQSLYVGSEDTSPSEVFFKYDGTVMYITGYTNDRIYQYTLTTPWDISTASYDYFVSIASQDGTPMGLYISPNGTSLYTSGFSNSKIYQYTFATPWDISTIQYIRDYYVGVAAHDVEFNHAGDIMFVVSNNPKNTYKYALSTAWDISTTSFVEVESIGYNSNKLGLSLSSQGTSHYYADNYDDKIYQWIYDDAWSFVSNPTAIFSISVGGYDSTPIGLYISPNMTKMYLVGSGNDRIYQFLFN